MAAATVASRVEGVTANARRQVDYSVTFANGTAVTLDLAVLGLRRVDEVWIKALGAAGIAVDWTVSSTQVTLDPSAAGTHVLRFVGYE